MAIDFPALTPTARQFTAPEWPTNFLDAQSGVTTRRLWGDKPARASLTLTFANVSDTDVAAVMQCHYATKGAVEEIYFAIPTMGDGSGFCDSALIDQIRLRTGEHKWHFAEREAVSVQSVGLGRSTVTCRFRSEIPG